MLVERWRLWWQRISKRNSTSGFWLTSPKCQCEQSVLQRFPVTLLQGQQRRVQKRLSHRQWTPQSILSLNTKVLRSGKVTVERQFCSVRIFRSLHYSYNSHKDTLASYSSVKRKIKDFSSDNKIFLYIYFYSFWRCFGLQIYTCCGILKSGKGDQTSSLWSSD